MTAPASPHTIDSVALYGSRRQEGHISSIWNLILSLKKAGIKVAVEKKLGGVLSDHGYRLAVHGIRSVTHIPDETRLAISVGGDGTFLRTARWLGGKEIPILGINTGHLGFLTENSADSTDNIVKMLSSGRFTIESRIMLEARCDAIPEDDWNYALNEVAFLKGAASMIDIHVDIDSFHLATYRTDGLIISTPTGSTAYNLSVGGPIIAPTLSCVTLSPIAPHSLTLRPIVVSADSEIEAVVESRAPEFRLSIDGRQYTVPCGCKVKIKKAPYTVLSIRKPGENFASTLRSKLLWGQ